MGWVFSSKPRNLKFSSMAPPPPSLSSILPPSHLSVLPPINPYLTHRYMLSPRPSQSLSFTTRYSPDNKQNDNKITYPPPPPPSQEKTSFGVATGELFLGIASRFLRSRNKNSYHNDKVSGLSLLEKSDDGNVDYEERIGAVMEDEVEPVGYIKETTPLAGSSAGAIVCAVIASGAGMQEALTATKVLAEDCRLRGTAFRLGAVLRDVLEKFLPDDIHVRCNGRVRVAVTQILWRPRGLLVDQFDSKEDLINAVVTSSFIPGYLAPRPATMFRNRLCIDGGLTLFMPPTSAAQTVRVCAFPASGLGLQGIGISPDCNPENRATPRELFNWALEPAEDHILDRLFELGYLDAAVWAEENPVQNVVQDGSP
ncbi:hypothetical protein OIU77_027918 [Salix suchowensis]|uniref:Patatin n=1 Tax=Salix suchowensis TaxID=1278906 RepID=A0ABQ9BUJ6_9ROSI|nr:hypothetical protein OIU77_027918 [Salix suchowensis]